VCRETEQIRPFPWGFQSKEKMNIRHLEKKQRRGMRVEGPLRLEGNAQAIRTKTSDNTL